MTMTRPEKFSSPEAAFSRGSGEPAPSRTRFNPLRRATEPGPAPPGSREECHPDTSTGAGEAGGAAVFPERLPNYSLCFTNRGGRISRPDSA